MKIKFLDFNSRWKVHCNMEVNIAIKKMNQSVITGKSNNDGY